MQKKILAIDFDGCLHSYSRGWQDGSIYDPPVPGAALALARLRRAGFHVMVYSTRSARRRNEAGFIELGQAAEIADYLTQHRIPYDEIFLGEKPKYLALIDDRAIRFDPKPPWWRTWFGLRSPWNICVDQLVRLGILKPGQGEEP